MRRPPLLLSLLSLLLLLLLALHSTTAIGCFHSLAKEEYEEAGGESSGSREDEARANARRGELMREGIAILNSSPETRDDEEALAALTHLVRWMPDRDVTDYPENVPPNSAAFLVRNTLESLRTRRRDEFDFESSVPWNVFLDFVLPYASLSEPRDSLDFRTALIGPFMREIAINFTSSRRPHAAKLSDLILEMNRRAWSITSPPIKFEAASANRVNFYSPREVITAKRASCTGESVFLVAALRSVGIPARIAGVPHWNLGVEKCPDGILSPACGNHNWPEAFTEQGEFAFLDQNAGGVSKLNTAWFFPEHIRELIPGDRDHAIFAARWSPITARDRTLFPLVFDVNATVRAVDRTKWYQRLAKKMRTMVQTVGGELVDVA